MNREIKFRVWDERNGEFVDDVCLCPDGQLVCDYGMTWYLPDVHIIQLYTGLKDKNGTEVYEGDIIDVGKNNLYFVQYLQDRFWLSQRGKEDDTELWRDRYYRICLRAHLQGSEVVGNIYENPELIDNG